MRHCKGCSHPTICNTHGCGVDEARANAERKKAVEAEKADLESLKKDAARYRWLRDYLISPSTHCDDLIVSADRSDTFDGVIDEAIRLGEQHGGHK